MNLMEIHWPVFKLGEKKPEQQQGLVFYYSEYADKQNNTPGYSFRVVDDQSEKGDTLGLRRLRLKADPKVKLFPIRTAIYFVADLVKLAKSTTWFIDNSGHVFHYEKNTRAKLQTRKIKQVLPASGLGCVIELEGIATRFKSMHKPSEFQQYARVLQTGMAYIFYGFCDRKYPDSWRMV